SYGSDTANSRAYSRGFRSFSAFYLLDTEEKTQRAGHLRGVRWTRRGSKSGRPETGFDFSGHRTSNLEWNRCRSKDSKTFPEIQNNLRNPGIFCGRGARSVQL